MKWIFLLLLPSLAWAQAEPAPEEYVPPQQRGLPPTAGGGLPRLPPEEPRWSVTLGPRMVLPMATTPGALPQIGLGGGVQIHRALIPLVGKLRFGIGFDFAYDRVFKDEDPFGTEQLSHATFAASLVFDELTGPGDRIRPWVALGGGLSIGSWQLPTDMTNRAPENVTEALGLVHFALGLAVRVYHGFELGLHGEANLTFSSTEGGMPRRPLFSPGFAALQLDLGFRF